MTDYFLYLFKHLATIISQELSVLLLNMFFQQFFMQMGDYILHKSLFFHGGSMSSMSQYAFKCFMASFAHQHVT